MRRRGDKVWKNIGVRKRNMHNFENAYGNLHINVDCHVTNEVVSQQQRDQDHVTAGIECTGLDDAIHGSFVGIVTGEFRGSLTCAPKTKRDSARGSDSDSKTERETSDCQSIDTWRKD
jgi:hypothetical protein